MAYSTSGTYVGYKIKAIHSKEYYVLMSETYYGITCDIATSGESVTASFWTIGNTYYEKYLGKNSKGTVTVSLQTLIDNWDEVNNLAFSSNYRYTDFITFSRWDTGIVTVGNFGYVEQPYNVSKTTLVETSENPTYDLLSLDTKGYLSRTKTYSATLTAANGRVIEIADASNIVTTEIPQGVYKAEVKLNGIVVLTNNVDFYTATDGVVWQTIDEYTVNDARVWRSTTDIGGYTTLSVINNVDVVSFTLPDAELDNTKNAGLRFRAIHSKEYYTLMSETYDAITFDVYLTDTENTFTIKAPTCATGGKTSDAVYQSLIVNDKVTFTVHLKWLTDNWSYVNNLTDNLKSKVNSMNQCTLFFTEATAGLTGTLSIGNFGCVAKTAE